MSSREEVAKAVHAKHELSMDNSRTAIMNANGVLSARTKMIEAVRALPGVSADPDTVPDILLLVDYYVQRKEQLSMDS